MFPGENVSPDLSSYEAMKSTWRGSQPCPTKAEVLAVANAVKSERDAVKYIQLRKQEYQKRGLNLDEVSEALIEAFVENRPEKLEAIQTIREEVKQLYPKPT